MYNASDLLTADTNRGGGQESQRVHYTHHTTTPPKIARNWVCNSVTFPSVLEHGKELLLLLRVEGRVENMLLPIYFFITKPAFSSPQSLLRIYIPWLPLANPAFHEGRKGPSFTEDLLCAKGFVYIKSELIWLQATENSNGISLG